MLADGVWRVISKVFVLTLGICLVLGGSALADTYYVNDSCGNDSWSGIEADCVGPDGPKATVQAGIDAAGNGDTVIVAPGIYSGDGNRDLDFGGKAITLQSVIPTDFGVVEATIIYCGASESQHHRGFNFHSGEDANSVVLGLSIVNGYSEFGGGIWCRDNSSPTILNCIIKDCNAYDGGGMYNSSSSPTVKNCTFSGNWAERLGGGVSNLVASPTFENCMFTDNSAEWGGGMDNEGQGSPTLTKCTFEDNTADWGGAIDNYSSNLSVEECTFNNNFATGFGGAVLNTSSTVVLVNCRFTGNVVGGGGGGIYNDSSGVILAGCMFSGNVAGLGGGICNDSSDPEIINCTFSQNSAPLGGGINDSNSSPILTNCVLWGNSSNGATDEAAQILTVGGVPVVTYSCIQDDNPNDGYIPFGDANNNIDDNPMFVDANGPDNVIGTEDDNPRISVGSVCMNVGNNSAVPPPLLTDIDGYPRIINYIVDMGAYEEATGSRTFYVNGTCGNDSWSGISPVCSEPNGPKKTIQAGIDVASYNDVVIISEGLYSGLGNRNIDFKGVAATVRSTDPNDPEVVAATVIDCNGSQSNPASGFIFSSGEDSNSVLKGLTIKNGYAANGGGIYCINDSGPEIINCVIKKCRAENYGGGIFGGSGDITNCVIVANEAGGGGGGLYDCDGDISNCDVNDNIGGGLEACDGDIENCSINANMGHGAAFCAGDINDCDVIGNIGDGLYECSGPISNCTISNNLYSGLSGCDGTITDCVITDNLRGLYDCDGDISNCQITGHTAGDGAGLFGCDGTISNNLITDNNAIWDGGGLFDCDGTITTCTIINNSAGTFGGGLVGCDGIISDCNISSNTAGIYGGGLYDCDSQVVECDINRNFAGYGGGGLYDCNGLITRCSIISNDANSGSGGGLYNCDGAIEHCDISYNIADSNGAGFYECNGTITNCVVVSNITRLSDGGGFYDCNGVIVNCTIADNNAPNGNGGGMYNSPNNIPTLTNCILWSNYDSNVIDESAQIFYDINSVPVVNYSCVQLITGDLGGIGNIGDQPGHNPLFAAPWVDDYHLRSVAGRWDPVSEVWVSDIQTSPCIDAGNPGFDWTSELWRHGQRINMGAYGGTAQASMSLNNAGISADLNHDYIVNLSDVNLLLEKWLSDEKPLAEDLDRDGIVNNSDYAILLIYLDDTEDPCFPAEMHDGFESNDFNSYNWQGGGDANWGVVSSQSWQGSYCAKSGSVGHNQTSELQLSVDLEFNSNRISFYRKVSTEDEQDTDYLAFYIDDVHKGQWYGEQDWALVSFPVNPKEPHTFKWVYERDFAGGDGNNCIWIDDIKIYFDPRE